MIIRSIILLIFSVSVHASFLQEVTKYLNHDPTYQSKQENQVSKELSLKEARSKLFLPSLNYSYALNNSGPYFSNEETKSKLSRFSLSYTLFNFGSDWKNYQASKNSLNSFKADKLQTKIEQEFYIIDLLLRRSLYTENIANELSILELKKMSLDITTNRYKRGSLSKDSLTRVKIDYYNTKSSLVNLKEDLNQVLKSLSGYNITQNQEIKTNKFPFFEFFKKHGINKVLGLKIKEETPRLTRYREEYETQKNYLNSVKLSHLGQISINYSKDKYFTDDNQDSEGWSSSIVYTLPLFENYSRQKAPEQAKINMAVSKTYYDYESRRLNKNRELTLENLKLANENFQNRLEILNDSSSLYKTVLSRYKKGRISVSELFVEQDRLLETKKFTNHSIYNLHIQYISYIHQLGLSVIENQNLFK